MKSATGLSWMHKLNWLTRTFCALNCFRPCVPADLSRAFTFLLFIFLYISSLKHPSTSFVFVSLLPPLSLGWPSTFPIPELPLGATVLCFLVAIRCLLFLHVNPLLYLLTCDLLGCKGKVIIQEPSYLCHTSSMSSCWNCTAVFHPTSFWGFSRRPSTTDWRRPYKYSLLYFMCFACVCASVVQICSEVFHEQQNPSNNDLIQDNNNNIIHEYMWVPVFVFI